MAGQDGKAKRTGTAVCAAALALTLCAAPVAAADEGSGSAADATPVEVAAPSADASPTAGAPASESAAAPRSPDSAAPAAPAPAASDAPEYVPVPLTNEEVPAQPDDAEKPKDAAAVDKRTMADSIYRYISALQPEFDRYRAEFDAAKKVQDDAVSTRLKQHLRMNQMNARLEYMKDVLSDFLVDLYKQGGMTPYYEVLLKSTSYREFLSSWYMMNEVSAFGRSEVEEYITAIETLEAQMDDLDVRVEEAQKVMQQAQVKLARADLTRLSLIQQAALLRMEAAQQEGNAAEAAAAKAEYDQAVQALNDLKAQGLAANIVLEGEGALANPCPGAVYSSGFGYRSFDNAFHNGLDMAIGEGTPYYAANDGVVIAATNDGGYNGGAGNWIVIDHGQGMVTKYMHSLTTFVRPGDHVVRGQNIGLVGNTGNSFGAHLHFQVELNGSPVNPTLFL